MEFSIWCAGGFVCGAIIAILIVVPIKYRLLIRQNTRFKRELAYKRGELTRLTAKKGEGHYAYQDQEVLKD